MPKYPNPKNQNDWRAGSPDTNFDAYQAPTTGNQAQHSYEMPRFDVPTGAEFWKPTAMGTQMASEALIDAERGQGLAAERLKQNATATVPLAVEDTWRAWAVFLS